MKRQTLNGSWSMKEINDVEWLDATVPGTVYTELLKHGKMEDPFWKDNEDRALALMEKDYIYQTSFVADKNVLESERAILRFDGIDTIAEVILNGKSLGYPNNMHRIWEYEVKELLNEEYNILQVILRSPLKYIRDAFEQSPTYGSEDCIRGFVHIRKAHCMFGWDWGAHLPDAGLYRGVTLLGIDRARIDSVYIRQNHSDNKVDLDFEIELVEDVMEHRYQVTITAPDGRVYLDSQSPITMSIEKPLLWWPNGYGEQHLYEILVEVFTEDVLQDSWKRRIGLRTIGIENKKDEWGEGFAYQVNGVNIFAMGADYIPEDHLLGRVNYGTTYKLLSQCKSVNFNSIRVWGGGYYPDDWFFDICDELGLVVWQDFMFACSTYDLTPEFKENIRQEFIDNVKRIRHHASLGLWCGNNEMEWFFEMKHNSITKHSLVRDYYIMFESLIPEVLGEYDPQRFYWPSSPSSGGSMDEPNSPDRGNVHYWEVWHGNKPFTEYRKFYFRFLSEFGFQSFPSVETIKTFTDDPEDMNPFSYIMERHQRNGGANGKIVNYLSATYQYPWNFEHFIYASQLLQAEAIRNGVEHFRRHRGRCMGAIYWQLNDCWPVISWSSIDYHGRWKALHYVAKRFFAPVMISCQEEGALTCESDLNKETYFVDKTFRLNVANETLYDKNVIVRRALRKATGEVIVQEEEQLIVPALTSSWLESVNLPDMDERNSYISFECLENGKVCSSGTVLLTLPKYFKFENPKLTYTVVDDVITVSASAYAKNVWISNENDDLILEDNYFDLNGDSRSVKILNGNADGIKLYSVYDIGRI
jgi:beta-mannosidase